MPPNLHPLSWDFIAAFSVAKSSSCRHVAFLCLQVLAWQMNLLRWALFGQLKGNELSWR